MIYKEEVLGNYINILSGFAFKTKDFVDVGIPIIKIKNICPPYVSLEDLTYVSKETGEKQKKFMLSYDDVLIAMTGSHINQWASVVGRVARVKYTEKTLLNQRVGKITVKENADADLDYIYYFLSQDKVKVQLAAKAGGTANQANISATHIQELVFPCPNIETQIRISNILKNYDDLIENNKKQIKLLEEAAERLYREWFVDLHFPRYENTEIIDGVPEGWKRKRLVDIADIQYGYAFDGSKFNDMKKGIPIVRIRNIPAGITSDYTTEETEEKYLIGNGDIIVGMDGEFHINSWSGDNAYLVQRTCCFRPKKKEMQGWLLWAIRKPIKYYEKTIVGATVSHLGKKHIDAIDLLVGPDELYVPFQNYFDKRQSLLNQNVLLLEARDRLLPRLMSGEVEV